MMRGGGTFTRTVLPADAGSGSSVISSIMRICGTSRLEPQRTHTHTTRPNSASIENVDATEARFGTVSGNSGRVSIFVLDCRREQGL